MSLITKIFGDANARVISSFQSIIERINELTDSFTKLNDDDLKAKTAEFRIRLRNGETLDDLLPEAFAAVREAAHRTIHQKPFYV